MSNNLRSGGWIACVAGLGLVLVVYICAEGVGQRYAVAGCLFALILLFVYRERSLSRSIEAVAQAASSLVEDDHNGMIPFADSKNEIGDLARAVLSIKNKLFEADNARRNQEQSVAVSINETHKALAVQTEAFEKAVLGIVETMEASAERMQTTAASLASTAEKTTEQAVSVASAAEVASAFVQSVAAATEELSSSIREISSQVVHSSSVTQSAVAQATQTDAQVQGLSEAAQRISEVVKLISDIASQTNLLALNATIEAARAGEAGKGFAVVASEVKNLATQTGKATGEISEQILGVQTATKDAVAAIQGIGNTIRQSNEIVSAIAAAVEEQGAATKEIASNAQQASTGTTEISANANMVTATAMDAASSASLVMDAAKELSQLSASLQSEVGRFVSGMKTVQKTDVPPYVVR